MHAYSIIITELDCVWLFSVLLISRNKAKTCPIHRSRKPYILMCCMLGQKTSKIEINQSA